jgi:hypothetical protein
MEVVNESKLNKIGQLDYVQDGALHRGANAPSVMVTAQADLAELPDVYPPGTIAYTAGFKAMWQLGADGVWVSMT